ncbi:hypothetical protein DRO02_01440 [archaeon]|nr:MAG: hypothetical protein DRO02_01440 [archaeon]
MSDKLGIFKIISAISLTMLIMAATVSLLTLMRVVTCISVYFQDIFLPLVYIFIALTFIKGFSEEGKSPLKSLAYLLLAQMFTFLVSAVSLLTLLFSALYSITVENTFQLLNNIFSIDVLLSIPSIAGIIIGSKIVKEKTIPV